MEKRRNYELRSRVRSYMEEYNMTDPGTSILAGVSGGSDSIAMLHILSSLRKAMGFELYAVHVHHGIRGEEADYDERITLETAKLLDVPCRSVRRSVPELAETWKKGEEETGRIVRRQVFEEEIRCLGLPQDTRIALAHNMNDVAETVLHNLARGTGLRGIGSMKPCSGRLIRPLLCLTKEETVRYLAEEGIPFADDRTNAEDHYTRNRIRHYIIPAMEEMVNPQASRHLAQAALFCGEASGYLMRRGQHLLEKCPRKENGYFLNECFMNADPVEKEYIIIAAFENLSDTKQDLQAVHVKAVMDLTPDRNEGKHVDLPYGLQADRLPGGIRIAGRAPGGQDTEVQDTDDTVPYEAAELVIPKDGSVFRRQAGGYEFCARIFPFTGQNIEEKKYTKWFDYDKIKGGLYIRQRLPGDWMSVTETGIRKKLRRVMIDDRIPREQRDRIPVVALGQEVIWITGFRPGAMYRISSRTSRILEISVTEKP